MSSLLYLSISFLLTFASVIRFFCVTTKPVGVTYVLSQSSSLYWTSLFCKSVCFFCCNNIYTFITISISVCEATCQLFFKSFAEFTSLARFGKVRMWFVKDLLCLGGVLLESWLWTFLVGFAGDVYNGAVGCFEGVLVIAAVAWSVHLREGSVDGASLLRETACLLPVYFILKQNQTRESSQQKEQNSYPPKCVLSKFPIHEYNFCYPNLPILPFLFYLCAHAITNCRANRDFMHKK